MAAGHLHVKSVLIMFMMYAILIPETHATAKQEGEILHRTDYAHM